MVMHLKGIAVVALFALTGCATVSNQPYNKEANTQVKTIVVLPAPEVPEYSINIMYHPGASFGLVGGLIAAAELSSKASDFTADMQGQHLDVAKMLTEAVKTEVEKRGYAVVLLDDYKRDGREQLQDYGTLPGKGDAYLDFVVTVAGYWANSHTTPYYPMLSAPVRLVSTKDKTVLYNSLIVYGPFGGPKGATHITPDSTFAIDSFDTLRQSPTHSADGLKSAVQAVAKQIASDL